MISHYTRGSVCIISLQGRITLNETSEIELYLTALLNMHFEGIVLNFAKVIHLDSSGIGLITALSRKLMKKQIKLVFCHFDTVLNEIKSAIPTETVSIYDTEEEALASFQL
ncbi:MAG: STAS domain-containing protein [SAR324 cluster bacterium]|nr:STAS domain-containing protein [SAR324 cluster bacterium]